MKTKERIGELEYSRDCYGKITTLQERELNILKEAQKEIEMEHTILQAEVAQIEQERKLLFQQNIALGKQLELTQKDYNEVKEELLATLNDRRERERKLQSEVENLSKYETDRVNKELKRQAEDIFNDLEINFSIFGEFGDTPSYQRFKELKQKYLSEKRE